MANFTLSQAYNKKSLFFLVAALLLISSLPSAYGDDTTTINGDYNTYLRFHWKGDLTSHSILIKAFPNSALTSSTLTPFLAVYTKAADGTPSLVGDMQSFDRTKTVSTLKVTGLSPSTTFYYQFIFSSSATLQATDFNTYYSGAAASSMKEFTFKTFGIALAQTNFAFGIGCCTIAGSVNAVFETLATSSYMNFFIYAGDMFDNDITTANQTAFEQAYYTAFDSTNQKDFFQNIPIVYVWDDEDYGGTADGKSVTRDTVTEVYEDFVPVDTDNLKLAFPADDTAAGVTGATAATAVASPQTYTVPADYGIFRSFIVGRCLFIILDLRSFKDITSGDLLGSAQASWLQNQLMFAGANSNIVQVFIVSTLPYVNKGKTTDWSSYTTTQTNIKTWVASYITANSKKVMMIGGHAGMFAFDDGTNNQYGSFPVVQAGALDENPGCEGGAYSHGITQGRQQYGVLNVTDTGSTVCVTVEYGKLDSLKVIYDTCNANLYTANSQTCSSSIIDKINDVVGGGSWVWFILLLVLLAAVVAVILWKAYQSYKARKDRLAALLETENNYLEMTESSKKKKQNEQNELL